MKIYANHAHVFPKSIRENGTVDVLLQTMDDCGIEKAVAFATFPNQLGPGDEEPNAALYRRIQSEERLRGFGIIDFSRNDFEDQVEAIYQLGFPGIKLHPACQQFRIDGEAAFRVYGAAQEKGLFLSFHTGVHWHRISEYNVLLFDEVAYHFSKLRFSMEHVGGYCFFHEAVAVMENNESNPPRIYAGLTSVFDPVGNKYWHQNDGRIHDLLWQTGEDTGIFGLDFPYNNTETIRAAIRHVQGMDLPDSAKEKILGGNLRRVLSWDRE